MNKFGQFDLNKIKIWTGRDNLEFFRLISVSVVDQTYKNLRRSQQFSHIKLLTRLTI